MSWNGYFVLDDAEFANSTRFEAYAAAAPWFIPAYSRGELGVLLDETYIDPATDSAPWYDPEVEVSADFWGFYPTSVTGLDDSSRSANPTESTLDGGIPGRVRHASKQVVFAGMLAGASEEAVEYGMKWLRRTLLGGLCSPRDARKQALGADLVFLGAEPIPPGYRAPIGADVGDDTDGEPFVETFNTPTGDVVDVDGDGIPFLSDLEGVLVTYDLDGNPIMVTPTSEPSPEQRLFRLTRRLRRVDITNGPTVNAQHRLGCGDYLWLVQFTATAGDPYDYSEIQRIFSDWTPDLDPDADPPDIWAPGAAAGSVSAVRTYEEDPCGQTVWTPLYDPACAMTITPPTPPNVQFGCWTPPAPGTEWSRWTVVLPGGNFPLWSEMLPVLSLTTADLEVRDLRIRFYRDDTENLDPDADPCSFLSDLVVSYIPPYARMVIDGSFNDVHVTLSSGHTRRADSLVFATNMRPPVWPVLACGVQHLMTVDARWALPTVNLDLIGRAT